MDSDILRMLRTKSNWYKAIENLHALNQFHGDEARANARGYAAVYEGSRGAMVVDVVASRRRTYATRVRRIVSNWKTANADHTIAWLIEHPLEPALFGLSAAEVITIHQVAKNLRTFAEAEQLDGPDQEDDVCRLWADRYGCFEHAPKLDPVVGSVKGIGLALFAYMRMRSGSNAIKPDIRVKNALRALGFSVPDDDHAVMITAKAAAAELEVAPLVLDQLLWRM